MKCWISFLLLASGRASSSRGGRFGHAKPITIWMSRRWQGGPFCGDAKFTRCCTYETQISRVANREPGRLSQVDDTMSALTLKSPDDKRECSRALAQSRGTSANRLLDEATTLLLAEFDAETCSGCGLNGVWASEAFLTYSRHSGSKAAASSGAGPAA